MSAGPQASGRRRKVLGWQEVSKAWRDACAPFDWRGEIREHAAAAAQAIHPGSKLLDVELNEGLSDQELERLGIDPEPPDSDLFIVVTMTTVEVASG